MVSVEIPAGGLPGESDTAVITATSQGDPAAVDQASITTTVTEWMEATAIPHPTGLAGYAQCPDDPDHFYVVGGADDKDHVTRLVWRYDILSDNWESLAQFPHTASLHLLLATRVKIYLLRRRLVYLRHRQ